MPPETTTAETSADQTSGQETSSATEAAAAAAAAAAATGEAKPFYEGWADDLKAAPAILKFKDPQDLARAYMAAENRLGIPPDQLVRLPKGLDDKEGVASVMKALGAPESADGYQLELAEGSGEADLAMGKDFAAAMHAVSAPPFIVKAAVDWFNKQTADAAAAETTATETANAGAEKALKEAWGATYDSRMGEIGRLLAANGGEELAAELDRTRLGANVQLMTALGKILDRMAEPGSLPNGGGPDRNGLMTPGQATAARQALENDPIKGPALHDGNHSMHKSVVEERNRYFRMERGETA